VSNNFVGWSLFSKSREAELEKSVGLKVQKWFLISLSGKIIDYSGINVSVMQNYLLLNVVRGHHLIFMWCSQASF